MLQSMQAKVLTIGAALALVGGAVGGAAIISAVTTGAETPNTIQLATPSAVSGQPGSPDTADDDQDDTVADQDAADEAADEANDASEADEASETDDSDAGEPGELQLPGSGHQDSGAGADHQFEGTE